MLESAGRQRPAIDNSSATHQVVSQEGEFAGLRDPDDIGNTDNESLENVDAILSMLGDIFRSIMSPTLEENQCAGTATFGNSDNGDLKADGRDGLSQCERCLPSPRRLF